MDTYRIELTYGKYCWTLRRKQYASKYPHKEFPRIWQAEGETMIFKYLGDALVYLAELDGIPGK